MVAKIELQVGKLFVHGVYIVTHLTKHLKNVVKFYNSGDSRAMDQGRQQFGQIDEALLLHVQG